MVDQTSFDLVAVVSDDDNEDLLSSARAIGELFASVNLQTRIISCKDLSTIIQASLYGGEGSGNPNTPQADVFFSDGGYLGAEFKLPLKRPTLLQKL